MRTVTLYTRPGCHLCDDARETLTRLRRQPVRSSRRSTSRRTTPSTAPISSASPSSTLDGEHLCDYFLDEQALTARLSSKV